MTSKMRRRMGHFWHHPGQYYGYCPYLHGHYGPPPWHMGGPAGEEEKEDLKEHLDALRKEYLDALKEEIRKLEQRIEELEKTGKPD